LLRFDRSSEAGYDSGTRFRASFRLREAAPSWIVKVLCHNKR